MGNEAVETEFQFGLKQRFYNWHLRTAREARGMTQEDLSVAAGLKPQMVGVLERLYQYPSENIANALSLVLDLPVETIFPEWLREFRVGKVPQAIDEKHLSLSEAKASYISERKLLGDGGLGEVEHRIGVEELQQPIAKALSSLHPRERTVIERRFGLNGAGVQTCAQIGLSFGVTGNRIWQIEQKALRRLRHPDVAQPLRPWLED